MLRFRKIAVSRQELAALPRRLRYLHHAEAYHAESCPRSPQVAVYRHAHPHRAPDGTAHHAAVLTVHLEALMPAHPHRHRQIKVTHTAIGKFSSDKPAIRSELLNEPGLDAHDLTSQKAGRIDEMAPV